MKGPKIIEIAVICCDCYMLPSHEITIDYSIWPYLAMPWGYEAKLNPWIHNQTSQLSIPSRAASYRSLATAEMLMFTAPVLTKMWTVGEKSLWNPDHIEMELQNANDPKWTKPPKTVDNAQVLAFFPPDHPVCQFWRPAWQSYTPWPWTAIHVQKPCSWRKVSEKPRMLCLVIGFLSEDMRYLSMLQQALTSQDESKQAFFSTPMQMSQLKIRSTVISPHLVQIQRGATIPDRFVRFATKQSAARLHALPNHAKSSVHRWRVWALAAFATLWAAPMLLWGGPCLKPKLQNQWRKKLIHNQVE